MTQPAPGYRPYQQPMAPMMGVAAPPKPSRGGVTTLLAGVLALIVAGMAVGGSFGAISTYRNTFEVDDDESVYASRTTWWGFTDDGSSSPIEGEDVLAGLTLVLAGTLLVVGAVFAFVAARTRRPGAVAGTRSLLSAGVGVLAGAVVLQLLALLKQMDQYNEQELDAGEALEFSAGLGLWLPLGGVVLGVVAVVLAHVGQGALRVEPNTPRMGFPAPYGYRPQQMPAQQAPVAERPTDVQTPEDDAADTQVVSGATAAGTAPAAPALPAPTAPPAAAAAPAPPTPPATSPAAPAAGAADEGVRTEPAPVSEPPASAETPITPATTAAPSTTDAEPAESAAAASPATEPATPAPVSSPEAGSPASAAAPAEPAEPAQPSPPSEPPASPDAGSPASAAAAPDKPAEPTTTASPAAPAAEPSPPSEAPASPEAASAAEPPTKPAEPSPLSDLPAAPPAPELSSSDDKNDK